MIDGSYGDVKCRACGVEIEDHPSMIATCEELQDSKIRIDNLCLTIDKLRRRIVSLEVTLEEAGIKEEE